MSQPQRSGVLPASSEPTRSDGPVQLGVDWIGSPLKKLKSRAATVRERCPRDIDSTHRSLAVAAPFFGPVLTGNRSTRPEWSHRQIV